MAFTLFKSKDRTSYPTKLSEPKIDEASFKVFKFNNRPRPDSKRTLFISCFSEFGCETVGILYCLPKILKRFAGYYIIGIGWHGREYLYRHLLDEFWEIDENLMWLRDQTYAFHHNSVNLTRIEQVAGKYGTIIPSSILGRFAIYNYCRTCGFSWNEWRMPTEACPHCSSTCVVNSLFADAEEYNKTAIRLPKPSQKLLAWADTIVGPNTVGICARGRKTYGRNLPPEFYTKLIERLESLGYSVIWIGEKQSTIPCPVEHVVDFSRLPESRDLERTLAIICRCAFTIQFWTASSRLAGLMGVPYVLFESPEQIYCSGYNPGQEGRRLELTTFGHRKIVLSHYLSTLHDPDGALNLVEKAIYEMGDGNFEDMIGLVEDDKTTQWLKDKYYGRTMDDFFDCNLPPIEEIKI